MKSSLIRNLSFPAIDGIRFYAALAVFFEHLIGGAVTEYFGWPLAEFNTHTGPWWHRVLAYFQDGNHGVDVFFIISGFLMIRIVTADGRRFSYAEFIAKRVKRIYPAFFVSLCLAAFVHCYFFGWTWKVSDFFKDMVFLNALPGYSVIPYNFVSWSLGYEFAFYFIIPVILVLSRIIDRRLAAIGLMVLSVVAFHGTAPRMTALFAGAVVGAFDDGNLKIAANKIPLLLIGGLYIACGIMKATLITSYALYYYPFVCIASLFFVKIVWDGKNVISAFLSSRPLRILGTLSYSIYLYHTIVASIVLHYFSPWPASIHGFVWYMGLSFVATLVVSLVSYRLVEQRYFARGAHHTSRSDLSSEMLPAGIDLLSRGPVDLGEKIKRHNRDGRDDRI